MPLPTALQDREYQKFDETDTGEVAVRVTGANFSGEVSITGLNVAGRITEILVNDTTWTALPVGVTALANRNAMTIQNQSNAEIKLNYSNAVSGYVGVIVSSGSDRFYDIQGGIALYVKAAPGSGTVTIVVEELA